jgi:glycosyltransferase involved in cell wall biosynthesis
MLPHEAQAVWHLLQVSDVLDIEFAAALAESVPVIAWDPRRTLLPPQFTRSQEDECHHRVPNLRVRRLPLLRGFSRFPLSTFAGTATNILERLLRQTPHPELSPLVCTVPFFASVAEQWPGPVIYWLTDLIAEYSSADRIQVHRLDRRMCAAATLVCPNSNRLKDYLIETAGCDSDKINIVPNATRAANLHTHPPPGTHRRHTELEWITRPIAGVIGNLAGNMDWLLLQRLIGLTPDFFWVFVGPISMHVQDPKQRHARIAVMHHPNTYFTGKRPYKDLASYARSFDVAVLPYRMCEPTYSGSSSRFYEHLAACTPMVATRSPEELLSRTPLLQLIDTAEQAADILSALLSVNFEDGLRDARWKASLEASWQVRAATVQAALAQRSQNASSSLLPETVLSSL